jgi:hypothetical protein
MYYLVASYGVSTVLSPERGGLDVISGRTFVDLPGVVVVEVERLQRIEGLDPRCHSLLDKNLTRHLREDDRKLMSKLIPSIREKY